MRRLPLILTSTVVVGLVAAGCSGGADDASVTDPVAPPTSEVTQAPATSGTTDPVTSGGACDGPARECLLPWPDDALTVPADTPTGRRLDLPARGTPLNVDGVPIDVTDQNRADGFSPGSAILVDAPGVDLGASNLAPSTDIGASLRDDAGITVIDTATGERWPYWAELDAQADEDEERLLMLHPARAWTEGRTFAVEIEGLQSAAGTPVETETTSWEFTIASSTSLTGRLVSMVDDALGEIGDGAPAFEVTSVSDGPVRTVEGAFDIPNHLTGDGGPGNQFELDADGLPMRSTSAPTARARFRCVLPSAPAAPVPTVVYGHGLLGSRDEVDFFGAFAAAGQVAACATDWLGMSSEDIGTVTEILTDVSRFPEQADRLQQGQLAFVLLGRLVDSPAGFASDPAFRTADGSSVLAPDGAVFVGNSQGGILGGAASAVSDEWSRVVLGVPAMNYSLLLPRSSDWPQFQVVFDVAYPDAVDRALALQLIQLLWDRGENQGYAQHLTSSPLAGVDAKQVLLVEAFGDHQVANVATEVLARTIDARAHDPTLAEGRSADVDPQWGIDPLAGDDTAVLVVWDFGTPAPPPVNLPPSEPTYGQDPHGAGSEEPLVLAQALAWLLEGTFVPCPGPCVSDVLSE